MKRIFNPFYLVLLLLGIGFLFFFQKGQTEVLSFYGFAESNETEINYNYPIVVDELMVTPGQEVNAGDELLKLKRISSKESLADESFRIDELQAESRLWTQRKKDDLARKEKAYSHEVNQVNRKIQELEKELSFKQSLAEGLQSIQIEESAYNPIKDEIANLKSKLAELNEAYALVVTGIENELRLGKNPFAQRVRRLNAEADFSEDKMVQEIVVLAPIDGIVGNIFCKEAEHIPSYKTLMTFYEPHSSLIRGFVHEDLTLEVDIGKQFRISSLKDASVQYDGEVIGLGSRIVEIPTRLRKMPDLKTYGREVLISITKENAFLQKEKVAISNGTNH